MFRSKTTSRRRVLKKGIDGEENRRRREETAISLRRKERDDNLTKRRHRRGTTTENKENMGTSNLRTASNQHKLADLPRIVNGIRSGNPTTRLQSCTTIRQMLSVEKNPPINAVLHTGVAVDLVRLLGTTDTKVQFEACWALTNIASGTSEHTAELLKIGAVQAFVHLLRSPAADVREQAVWALGNVAGDGPGPRNLVLSSGGLKAITALCVRQSSLNTLRNCAWTLSNLCRGKPQPSFQAIAPMVPVLKNLLGHSDAEVIADTCWALSYISDDSSHDNHRIQSVVSTGIVPLLVRFLSIDNTQIQTPALRTIGNIVTGNDLQTQIVIQCNALPLLRKLLSHPKKAIRKETCWTISNITAGNKEQINSVVSANIIPSLVDLLEKAQFDVRKEAAWAISNAISGGNPKQIEYLVSKNIIKPFSDLFAVHDPKIILLAMETMDKILAHGQGMAQENDGVNKCGEMLEECGGLDLLEACQRHENESVYEKAVDLLQKYFDNDEEDEEVDGFKAPEVSEDANQFSFGTGFSTEQFKF
mmetsp:Transcript_13883/g.20967  ORF Transcript_13883/g.20967 Transcript_13883/m.20967 type:complete len:533 (-) Transcript_13883:56-1654(-)